MFATSSTATSSSASRQGLACLAGARSTADRVRARRMFLDLKRESMVEVATKVGVSVEELTKRVEDLTRLH